MINYFLNAILWIIYCCSSVAYAEVVIQVINLNPEVNYALYVVYDFQDGIVRKFITGDTDTLRILCPATYVIFNPSVLTGLSNNYSRSGTYCTESPNKVKAQLQKCHWRRHCVITFHKNDILNCGQEYKKSMERFAFVEIKQPYCIPKGIIIDSHRSSSYKIQKRRGVIRSHKRYPQSHRKALPPRVISIVVPALYTLYVELQRPKECFAKKDMVLRRTRRHMIKHGNRTIVKEPFHKVLMFNGSEVDLLEVVVRRVPRKKSCIEGFMMPFSTYPTESLKELMEWPKPSFSVIRDLEWIFEVRAVIEQCTLNASGNIILTCDQNEVIYAPEFSVAGHTRHNPSCNFGRYPCGGHTIMSLVQRNSCFWKNDCHVSWKDPLPILMSKSPSCIGYMASIIGMYGHRCVPKGQVFDVCSNCTEIINSQWGIIRSHPTYPWFFDSEFGYCKRIIQIGKGNKLLIIVQDINLDPDGRDKFTMTHKYKKLRKSKKVGSSAFTRLSHQRRVVMTTKAARSGVSVEVSEGRLVIHFRPFRRSKGGRGFVLVFKRFKTDRMKKYQDFPKQSTSDNVLFRDAAKAVRLRSNRRHCSGTRKQRQRGRACRPKVWTDIFTQLEER